MVVLKLAPALLAALLGAAGPVAAATPQAATVADRPGYVADEVCARCHTEIAAQLGELGMGRAFSQPQPGKGPEDFTTTFVHAASGRRFELRWQGERLVFRRYQLAADGTAIHLFEQTVDWVLGSGNHARTYLYGTPNGELYQLPIAWYTQEGRWGMAPGFDRPDHDGVLRRVQRECLFCHNAYPPPSPGRERYPSPALFAPALPEGIGCQRCHGPGAGHVARAAGGGATPEQVRAVIVNPARLPPERRDDVCNGCHLQPAVALLGVRRFDRDDFSFQPGEALPSYVVGVDVEQEGVAPAERFEINHQAYRLRQSRCFLASAGRLSCLTCHSPHRKVRPEERRDHFRAACLGCHPGKDVPAQHPAIDLGGGADLGDCVACHMPKRRPRDVVHVLMTDHKIRREPGGAELTAPRTESDPTLLAAHLADGARAPQGKTGEIYLTSAVVRTRASTAAVDALRRALLGAEATVREGDEDAGAAARRSFAPRYDLIQGELRGRRFSQALALADGLLATAEAAERPLVAELRAVALVGLGRREEARAALAPVVAAPGARPEALYNAARLALGAGEVDEAEAWLARATAERPVFAAAWLLRAALAARRGDHAAAIAAGERALAIEPRLPGAVPPLVESLLALGRREEARRLLDFHQGEGSERAALDRLRAALDKTP